MTSSTLLALAAFQSLLYAGCAMREDTRLQNLEKDLQDDPQDNIVRFPVPVKGETLLESNWTSKYKHLETDRRKMMYALIPIQVGKARRGGAALVTASDEVDRKTVKDKDEIARQEAEDEFDAFIKDLPEPEPDQSCTNTKTVSYAFAIGSIFNDESRRTSKLKSDVFTKEIWQTHGKDDPLDWHRERRDLIVKKLEESAPDCPEFAEVEFGFRRMWTYPSGGNNKFWAVSLHQDDTADKPVLGALVTGVDKEWFAMMRPREDDYEVLQIPPERIKVTKTGRTLRDEHPCDKVFAFAYGYKNVPKSSITEIFELEDRIKKRPSSVKQPWVPQQLLCELAVQGLPDSSNFSAKVCGGDRAWETFGVAGHTESLASTAEQCEKFAECENYVLEARGHVLAQSYIDVIVAGILEMGLVTDVGTYKVWGAVDTSVIRERGSNRIQLATDFVGTTDWPVDEISRGQVLYINDRPCPRNGNPLFTPKEKLASYHFGGTSSSAPDIDNLYALIDEIITSVPQGSAIMAKRMNSPGVCKDLPKLNRWTDMVLRTQDSLWDLAYDKARYNPLEYSQWQQCNM